MVHSARLSCAQLMESAQLTGDQIAELLRQRRGYLEKVAQLARARAPYEVHQERPCTCDAAMTGAVSVCMCTTQCQLAHDVLLLLSALLASVFQCALQAAESCATGAAA